MPSDRAGSRHRRQLPQRACARGLRAVCVHFAAPLRRRGRPRTRRGRAATPGRAAGTARCKAPGTPCCRCRKSTKAWSECAKGGGVGLRATHPTGCERVAHGRRWQTPGSRLANALTAAGLRLTLPRATRGSDSVKPLRRPPQAVCVPGRLFGHSPRRAAGLAALRAVGAPRKQLLWPLRCTRDSAAAAARASSALECITTPSCGPVGVPLTGGRCGQTVTPRPRQGS